MEKGAIYNLALAYLGKPEYEAGTAEEDALEKVVQHCIGVALDSTLWTFALRRVAIALDPVEGCGELPHDCLRVQRVHASRYELIGRKIFVEGGLGCVQVDYVTNEYATGVCLPPEQPLFNEAVVLLVASKIAPRVTSRFDLAEQLEARAAKKLQEAKLKDARQWASNDQEPETWRGTRANWGQRAVNVLVD